MKVWLWGIFLILRLPKWQVLRRHWPWYIAFSLAWTLVHLNSKVAMSRVIIKSINTNLSVKLNLLLIEKHSQNTRDTHEKRTSTGSFTLIECPPPLNVFSVSVVLVIGKVYKRVAIFSWIVGYLKYFKSP